MTKLKFGQNSKWDETQILTKLKTQIVTKLRNSNCDKTQKLKFWQNLKYDKSQFKTKDTLEGSFSKDILTLC